MSYLGRRFGLSDLPGRGVSCEENGVFVGGVPLLEGSSAPGRWKPRPASDLNRDLSMCYGLPVEFDRKLDGLRAVAQALGRGDVIHAQITTLHLRIPDPPAVGKSVQTPDEIIDLARQLRASDLLKGGVGPREASALAGRKSGQHRWRICSRWRGIRVFRGWRA